MKFTAVALAASTAIVGAAAQSIDIGSLPSCALSCVTKAIPEHCTIFQIECICSDNSYFPSLSCCILDACPDKKDQDAMLEIGHKMCDEYAEIPDHYVCPTLSTAAPTSTSAPETTSAAPTSTSAPETTSAAPTSTSAPETTAEATTSEATSAEATTAAATSAEATSAAATSAEATETKADATTAEATSAEATETKADATTAKATSVLITETKDGKPTTMATSVPVASNGAAVSGASGSPAPFPSYDPSLNAAPAMAANAGALAIAAAAMLL